MCPHRDDGEADDGKDAGHGADDDGAERLHHHVGRRAHRHAARQSGVLDVLLVT